MKIRVLNPKSEKDRSVVRFFAEWVGTELFGARLAKNCSVTISFKTIDDETEGQCAVADNKYRPRKFLINVDPKLKLDDAMAVIAHELTHAKQFARRELVHKNEAEYWHGEPIDPELDYWRHPWEVEAFGQQTCLYRAFHAKFDI